MKPYNDDAHHQGLVTIPCHHIRMGDILMLQGRPCQVIRISTSTATGQHRYLGVDVFNKQLYEESSVVSKLSPDVIVQTMSGPVFKQYRVLDIQNGTVVAMTELGDVKTGLPVLDQSELYSRLSSGFSTSDNVRVLVLSHFGNDMIVDFKVISPPDGRPRLHIAARKGEVSTIQNLLKQQSDIINQLDSVGRTALFDAVEGHHESVVRLLLDSGIRINQVDQRGEVALGIAIVDSGNPTLALLLLEKGASPVAGLPSDVLNLLSAVAAGKVDEVSRLLKAGVAANSRDRLGYTALHEAASRGFFEIVRELIGYGADVNAKTILGRDTVLHTVIERGRNNYQCTGLATGRPSIGEGHVKVVEILLHKGAVPELKRRDGLTVQALILKEFASSHLHDDERGFLREISKTLSIYPSLAKEDIGNVPDLELQEKMDVCNGFHLWIQYHTSRYSNHDKAPVGKFIWNQAGGNWGQGEAVNLETWANDVASEYLVEGTADKNDELPGDSYWRWVHLPANHKTWAKDVIRVLHNNPNIRFDGDLKKLNDFIDRSYYELRGSGSGVCMRRPFFSRSLDPKVVASSIVVPYFDMESLDSYINRGDSQNSHFRKKHALEKIYQRLGDGTMDLHVPCTLDQSYYLSLRDSTERDKTQVVAKYADFAGPDAPGLTATQGREIPKLKRKLLMVNQIWIWKFDSDTLITAFPDRWYQGQETELLSYISRVSNGDRPSTLNSMILQILGSTVGFMDPPNNGGLDKNLFDIFNEMIAHWANEETQCFNAFYKAQREQKERGEFEARIRDEDICDITKEVRILGEVKDIGDELKMIERVLQDQATVIAQYRASLNDPLPQEEMNRFITLDQDLSSRIYKAQRLTRDALSVENSLNHLLDLKQKQANFNEARDTRRLANEADNRAKSGEEQNQLLFVFTVITVVFTPLSFVTSFLAVPSQDFPQNDTGSGVSWRWWQVFAGSLVTEVIAFVGIALFWVPIWRVLGSGPRSMSISKKFMKNLRVYRDRILGRESHPSEQDLEGR